MLLVSLFRFCVAMAGLVLTTLSAVVAEKCTSFPASDSNTAVGGSGGKF